jgi:uncharacterized Ntn-hydrolase superfamily protein
MSPERPLPDADRRDAGPLVTTFSIVGYDPHGSASGGPAWGIAVSSRFLAVGSRTCYAAADAGVVVVQAHLNAQNGVRGLELMREGASAQETIDRLMAVDPHADLRQLAIIDPSGGVISYTGENCGPWAGGFVGEHSAAQGNMLLGPEGCEAMVAHFERSQGTLERRLVDALTVGDRVAGDSRGRQAAALLTVRARTDTPFDLFDEPTIDLRVDDHPDPFLELARLLDLHELVYLETSPDERLPQEPTTVARLQRALTTIGVYTGAETGTFDDATRTAVEVVARNHNLKRRLDPDGWPDARTLTYLEGPAQHYAEPPST